MGGNRESSGSTHEPARINTLAGFVVLARGDSSLGVHGRALLPLSTSLVTGTSSDQLHGLTATGTARGSHPFLLA